METLNKILATSNGKDKIMRIVCYSAMLASSCRFCPKKPLLILASQLSTARTVTRLFDDLPMLAYSLQSYQNLDKFNDIFEALLVTLNNVVDQLYYPVEHLVSKIFGFS